MNKITNTSKQQFATNIQASILKNFSEFHSIGDLESLILVIKCVNIIQRFRNITVNEIQNQLPNNMKNIANDILNITKHKNNFDRLTSYSKTTKILLSVLQDKLHSLDNQYQRNYNIIPKNDTILKNFYEDRNVNLSDLIKKNNQRHNDNFYINNVIQYDDMNENNPELDKDYTKIDISNDQIIKYPNFNEDNTSIVLIIPGSNTCNPKDYEHIVKSSNFEGYFIPHRGSPNTLSSPPKNNHEMLLPTLKTIDKFRKIYPDKKIYIYGHSLGGAIAAESVKYHIKKENIYLITDRAMSSMSETIKFKSTTIDNKLLKIGMNIVSLFTTKNHFYNYELFGRSSYQQIPNNKKLNFYLPNDENLGFATIQEDHRIINNDITHSTKLDIDNCNTIGTWVKSHENK